MNAIKISAIIISFLLYTPFIGNAQYEFSNEKTINCTSVKNQNRTGTCWSYATSSFIESELMRMGHEDLDLSEMFVVRNIYKDKAMNYVLRQGKANFSEGSLAHDLLRVASKNGLAPQSAYLGTLKKDNTHDHSEMSNALKGFLDGVLKSKVLSDRWPIAFEAIINSYLGTFSNKFNYDGKEYSPIDFAKSLGFDSKNYVNITSFTHHPFGSSFILEIPDNYSNGSFYNMPLDKLISNINHALSNGYSIAWDGDVSEKGFSAKNGLAILPVDPNREDLFENIGDEIITTQNNRQANFLNYKTTDDHLMHIVGTAKDQNGNNYYLIKNSWGEIGQFKGYLYMSEAYLKMKTISVTLHKDGLQDKI